MDTLDWLVSPLQLFSWTMLMFCQLRPMGFNPFHQYHDLKGLGELFPGFDSVIYCWVTNYCRFIGCREHMCVSQFLLLESRRALDGPTPFRSFRKIKSRAGKATLSFEGQTEEQLPNSRSCKWNSSSSRTIGMGSSVSHRLLAGGCPLFLATWALPFGPPQVGASIHQWLQASELASMRKGIVLCV